MSVSEPGHRGMRPGPEAPGGPLVVVRYWAAAAHAAGVDEERLSGGATVGSVLDEAVSRHPALAEVLPACSVLVDGRVAAPDQDVATGTILEVLPPFAGG